jgi:hypothetical protein
MKKLLQLLLIQTIGICSLAFSQGNPEQPKGKFSGYMFGDYFYNIQMRDTTKKDLNGIQFRRIYFTYDYAISSNFDTRFRLEADQAALTSNGKVAVFVKDAYLKWKGIFTGSDLLFGFSPTPAYDVSEELWGYRSLEKTIMDLRGIVPSRDLAIDLKGKLTGDGVVNYWLKFGDNSGNSPEANKFKRYYGFLDFKFSSQFRATAYADFDAEAKKLDSFDRQFKDNNRTVFAGFLNYREENKYSFGLEAFYRMIQNNYRASATTAYQDEKAFGLTAFAWGSIADEVRLIGRYDYFDPNSSADNDVVNLFILALDYMPTKDVHVMPNLYLQTYQMPNVASDVIGRVTFYYIFR